MGSKQLTIKAAKAAFVREIGSDVAADQAVEELKKRK